MVVALSFILMRITMGICDLTASRAAVRSQMLIVIHILFCFTASRNEMRIPMDICDLTASGAAVKSQMFFVVRIIFRFAAACYYYYRVADAFRTCVTMITERCFEISLFRQPCYHAHIRAAVESQMLIVIRVLSICFVNATSGRV